jgi:hypothetical protein
MLLNDVKHYTNCNNKKCGNKGGNCHGVGWGWDRKLQDVHLPLKKRTFSYKHFEDLRF